MPVDHPNLIGLTLRWDSSGELQNSRETGETDDLRPWLRGGECCTRSGSVRMTSAMTRGASALGARPRRGKWSDRRRLVLLLAASALLWGAIGFGAIKLLHI